ncbi:MAG: hypothetical protein LBU99_03715 [Spirochaetaceae bacterium]|jgi:hypothetical protein|nr:hypothetical protein [Spirochaetaceae bacterium]
MKLDYEKTQKTIDEVFLLQRMNQKSIGEFGNTMGSLVEHLLTPALPHKLKEFGFNFEKIQPVKLRVDDKSIYAEIDAYLENEKQVMAVEVKTTLRAKDVDYHLIRMEKLRIYADETGDTREFFGAMAGAIVSEGVKKYALSQGFFVIEPSGEDVIVTKPTVEPKKW